MRSFIQRAMGISKSSPVTPQIVRHDMNRIQKPEESRSKKYLSLSIVKLTRITPERGILLEAEIWQQVLP